MIQHIRNSAKAIIIQTGQLLTIRHGGTGGNWFSLPGGGQRPSETLMEALERECMEEIGAKIKVAQLRFVREYIGKNHEFSFKDGDMHQIEFMFACEIENGYSNRIGCEPDKTQTGVSWLELATLEQSAFYPKTLCQFLKGGTFNNSVVYLGDVN